MGESFDDIFYLFKTQKYIKVSGWVGCVINCGLVGSDINLQCIKFDITFGWVGFVIMFGWV